MQSLYLPERWNTSRILDRFLPNFEFNFAEIMCDFEPRDNHPFSWQLMYEERLTGRCRPSFWACGSSAGQAGA